MAWCFDVAGIRQCSQAYSGLPGWEGDIHIVGAVDFHLQKGYNKGLRAVAELFPRFPELTCHVQGGLYKLKDIEP